MKINRFYYKDDPNYVFKPDYHRKIPADGFPQYAQSIWVNYLKYIYFNF